MDHSETKILPTDSSISNSYGARLEAPPNDAMRTDRQPLLPSSLSPGLYQSRDRNELGDHDQYSHEASGEHLTGVRSPTLSDASSVYSQPEWEMDPERPVNKNMQGNSSNTHLDALEGTCTVEVGIEIDTLIENRDIQLSKHEGLSRQNGSSDIMAAAVRSPGVPSCPLNIEKVQLYQSKENNGGSRFECSRGLDHSEYFRLPGLSECPKAKSKKSKRPPDLEVKKSSFFKHFQESMARGILEVTSPGAGKSAQSNAKQERAAPDLSPRSTLRKEQSGPARSPLKRILPLSFSPPSSEHAGCSNEHRWPSKAEGQRSPKPGFMSEFGEALQVGSDQLEEAFSKVKRKLSVKVDPEKRRESLKKKITLVRTEDRSPGMQLALLGRYTDTDLAVDDEGAEWV